MQKCVSILLMSRYLKKVPKNLKNFLITFLMTNMIVKSFIQRHDMPFEILQIK